MAYAGSRRCPRTHPVPVPEIELVYRYPTLGGPGTQLSSGGQYSAHGDFVNAWSQGELTRLIKTCLNSGRGCGSS
jgi:hypothetical protein